MEGMGETSVAEASTNERTRVVYVKLLSGEWMMVNVAELKRQVAAIRATVDGMAWADRLAALCEISDNSRRTVDELLVCCSNGSASGAMVHGLRHWHALTETVVHSMITGWEVVMQMARPV